MSHRSLIGLSCFYLLGHAASAQCETQELSVAAPQSDEWLGYSLAVHQQTLLAGAPYRPVSSQHHAGAVSIFEQSGGLWLETGRLQRANPDSDDLFGFAVALEGDRALIGVPGFGPLNGGRGLVFERSGGSWSQVAALQANDTFTGRSLGAAVALEGDLAVLGGPYDSEFEYLAGSAYVFERVGGVWSQSAKLSPSVAPSHRAFFGKSVALSGDTVVVAAPNRGERGAVFVYRRGASGWDEEAMLEAVPLQRNFGRGLALEGDRLAIGAGEWSGSTSSPGKVYIYERSGTSWTEMAALDVPTASTCNGSFGSALALAGDRLLVGAPSYGCADGASEGSLYLFERNAGAWQRLWAHRPANPEARLCGLAVALSGGEAFASAPATPQGALILSAGEVLVLDPDPLAQTYCSGAPNSVGAGARMDWRGSTGIAQADFTLVVDAAIPAQPGLFYYGASQASLPFGDGTRCVAGASFRLAPVVFPDASGSAEHALDFSSPPASGGAGQILPGATWYFQFWYRDPAAGGTGFNLSDGLAATFCP